ncbi:MAG: trigger factor [Rickettsiales bacterium]|jgi:trigger factor|nr:trigger factor [Rickettsiales bacterium]
MEARKILIRDSKLKKEFDISIPKDLIAPEVDRAISQRQKNYKLDGFRIGKVPLDIVKKREYVNCFLSTVDNFIGKLVFDLASENNYKLALKPKINFKILEPDGDVIELSVIYELAPEIENIDFKTIKLDRLKVLIGENDVDRSIENILAHYKNFVKRDGAAQLGDKVLINFSGTIDGDSFPGSYAEDFWLELGSRTMIDNFEEQIVDKNTGDEFTVEVTFPLNYHKSSMVGKTAIFEVKLLDILRAEKVTVTDEFLKNNFAVESTEKFREIIRAELTKNYSRYSKKLIKNMLFSYLDKNMAFDLPESLVEEHYSDLLEFRKKYNLRNSLEDSIDEEILKREAISEVKISLLLSKISSENNITVSNSEITGEIMKEATDRPGHEIEIINFYKDRPKSVDSIRNMILEDKTVDFILNSANLKNKEITIEELLKFGEHMETGKF